ncbi:MAG: hypothetical protein AAFO69_04195 [Bacteroidota bacterium]
MAKFEVNYEENIKAGKYRDIDLLKLDDDGRINLQQLRLTGVITPEKMEQLNKLRLHLSLTRQGLSFEDKWQQINEHELDIDELLSLGVLNAAEHRQMQPLEEVDFPSEVWSKVPSVQTDRTDVFVVGGVSSGKTCFLAGLLEHCNRTAILFNDRNVNPGGGFYEDQLRIAVKEGRLFQRTPSNTIQYICASLKGEEKRDSPINVFDMSGEIFQFCFAKEKTEIAKLYPNFIEYIFNDNPKVFFLALNCSKEKVTMINQDQKVVNILQSSLLDNILEFLLFHGLIRNGKVKAICLLVTQWDLYHDQSDEGLDDFIFHHYQQLFKRLIEYEEKYQIKFKILPFSLGRFDQRKFYEFDGVYAKKAADFLLRTVPYVQPRKKGLIDKIFKKD